MKKTAYPKTRWFVLFNVFVGYLCVGIFTIALAPIIGTVIGDIKATNPTVDAGIISLATMGTTSLFSAISCILAGPLVDKFGIPRTTIIGGILMVVGALLVPAIGHSIAGIVVFRLIMGLGFGPISTCLPVIAASWFPEKERPIAIGLQGSGLAIGIAVGLVISPIILNANHGNWQATVAWLGVLPALSLVLCIVMAFLKWPTPPQESAAVEGTEKAQVGHLFAKALKQPVFYIGFFVMFAFAWVMNAFNDLTPGYIALDPPTGLGFGAMASGLAMMGVQVGMIIGSIASGFALRLIFKNKYKPTLIAAFIIVAIFMFSVRFGFVYNNSSLLFACLFIAGFFEGFIIPVMTTFIAANYPKSIMGKVYGTSFGLCLFGGTIGISAGAAALHITGNYHVSIAIVSVVAIIGIVISALLRPTKGFDLAEQKLDSKV